MINSRWHFTIGADLIQVMIMNVCAPPVVHLSLSCVSQVRHGSQPRPLWVMPVAAVS